MPYTPTVRTVKTLIGVQRNLEAMLNIAPINDVQTTLNTKYGVYPDTELTVNARPKMLYFGVGINGFRNVTDTNLSEPHEVKATNMDLYTPIPLRCVPFEQDLDATERANYRMRQVITVTGEQYVCYWLKKLTMLDATPAFTKTTIVEGEAIEEVYPLDYSNLSPTPPDPAVQGVLNEDAETINVTAAAQLLVLATEIQEAVNVLYGGDMRYAKLSEVGIYTGEDQTVSALDFNATPFNYYEAIFAQLALHRTWNGTDMSEPSQIYDATYRFTTESLVLST